MRRIAISGLVALAAALGGVAVPTAALAQPTAAVRATAAARLTAAVRPTAAARAGSVAAMLTARTALVADEGEVGSGEPLISCVLATDCLGVEGSSGQSDGPLSTPARIARWNGSSWKGVGVTLPKGARSVDLNGVSCKGAKSCLVVGDYYTSTSDSAPSHVLALYYNGTSLSPTATVPLPKGTINVTLRSVSCATTRYCVALGGANGDAAAFGPFRSVNIIETWNGAKWTLHTAAGSIGKTTALEPGVVSCAASAFCVLAGVTVSATSGSSTVKLYLASWNGKKLTTMKPATVGGDTDFLLATDVSCATAANCAVTGADPRGLSANTANLTAFTEIWDGKTWQLAKVTWPKGTTESLMWDVSCYAAHSCEAVGIDGAGNSDASPVDAAAVSFNGVTGTLQAVPEPSKGRSNGFTAVSCLPWGSCVATGETGKTNADSAAVLTGVRNGNTWKLDPGF